jgi:uncharacterized protein (TIGR01244 family)
MRLKATLGLVLLSGSLAFAEAPAVPQSVDPSLIPNYTVVKPGLAAAGRPTDEGLRQLKAQGFGTVIDLRTAAEDGQPDEKALVEAQGLKYVSVPLTAASLSASDVDAVERVLGDAASGPVLLHCQSANRVGGVWAVIAARGGTPIDDAIADGQRVGLRSAAMIEAARRVAAGAAAPKP